MSGFWIFKNEIKCIHSFRDQHDHAKSEVHMNNYAHIRQWLESHSRGWELNYQAQHYRSDQSAKL